MINFNHNKTYKLLIPFGAEYQCRMNHNDRWFLALLPVVRGRMGRIFPSFYGTELFVEVLYSSSLHLYTSHAVTCNLYLTSFCYVP